MWFQNKPKREEGVDETLSERVSRIEKRMTRLEAEILDVATAQDIIRDKVLRKIQKPQHQEEEKKDIYGGILIGDE